MLPAVMCKEVPLARHALQQALILSAGATDFPGGARDAGRGAAEDGPEMGAQFAQLVKELRSEYGGAVQACAFRISQVSPLPIGTCAPMSWK